MTAAASPVVRFEEVGITYGRTVVARSVSFDVVPVAVLALLGRNGAGKSSLVRCLIGVQRPSSGVIRAFGLDPWRNRVDVLHRTGVVPETPEAPSDLSARRLVRLCARLHAAGIPMPCSHAWNVSRCRSTSHSAGCRAARREP